MKFNVTLARQAAGAVGAPRAAMRPPAAWRGTRESNAEAGRGGASTDWITVGLCVAIYGLWIAATLWHDRVWPPVLALVGGWAVAWQGSLQHEVIHGHPTPHRRLNHAIAFAPLALWLPFEVYRRSHQAHHATEHLTDPAHDPEARYLPAGASRLSRGLAALQATLLGRLVLGPPLEVARFLTAEARLVLRGEGDRRRIWAWHLAGVVAVLAWLEYVCQMPLGRYLLCFVYPGAALSLLRSYAEHSAEAEPGHRTAVVERAPILGLLFLNNNLHAAHHDAPWAAWHSLPGRYARDRARLLGANGGRVYDGYAEVVRRHLLRARRPLVHPGGTRAGGTTAGGAGA